MIMCEQKDLNASLLGNRSGVCGSGADTLKKNLPLSLRFIVRLWAASSVENEIPR
jgi:predicted RNA-binding protein with PUA domain